MFRGRFFSMSTAAMLICLTASLGCARQVDEVTFDANPVAKEWLAAKQKFLDQTKLSIDTILLQIDTAENKARDSGDLTKVRAVGDIRKAFLERNEIDASLDRKKYDEIRTFALSELTEQKKKFVTSLLKDKQDAIAEHIDQDFTELSDPVMADSHARWTSAVAEYRKDSDEAKSLILFQFGELEEKARQKADVDLVERLKAQREAFEASGTIPDAVSRIAYDARRKKAHEKLDEANKQIVRALLLAKRDDAAAALSSEFDTIDQPRSTSSVTSGQDWRVQWINESYNSYVKHIDGSKWQEFANGTNKLVWNYKELDRNEKYIEMLLVERKQTIRFYADKASLLKDGKWEWLSNGKWVKEP